jgi:hypothetical protein
VKNTPHSSLFTLHSYRYGISFRIAFSLVWSRMADFRSCRFRFVVFGVMIWLVLALLLLIFPVPVTEKRFAAPRWVFIFGITSPLF